MIPGSARPRLFISAGALLACTLVAPAQPVAEWLWDGIVQYHADAEAAAKAGPSLLVQTPAHARRPAPADLAVRPVFAGADGKHTATIAIAPGTSLYGAGIVEGPRLLNGRRFICSDPSTTGDAQNQPLPWVLAVRADGTAFGVMADTTRRCELDLTGDIVFRVDGERLPIIVIDRVSPVDVVMALSIVTGWSEVPPKWALGYQHAGGLNSETEVRAAASEFRARGIPADVLWLGPSGPRAAGGFDLGHSGFGDVRSLNESLHTSGWRTMWTVSAAIPAGPGTAFEEGSAGMHWLPRPPEARMGGSVWVDLTKQATRDWWTGLNRTLLSHRFDGMGVTVADLAVPDDGAIDADEDLGGPGEFGALRGFYGTLAARTASESLKTAFPDRRAFVVGWSGHLSGQRYGAAWASAMESGSAARQIPVVLNAGISGKPIFGVDIAGAPRSGDGETLARDVVAASLLPMIRGYSPGGESSGDPWCFGARVVGTGKRALEQRARLMPYLYTVVLDAYRYSMPVARPLFFAAPADPSLRAVEDAYLIGNDLLVALPGAAETSRPPGAWRRFDVGDGDDALPRLYARAGTIIPIGPLTRHADEKPLEPLTLIVHLNEEGTAMGVLYEDEGEGLAYLKNQARFAFYTAETQGDTVVVKMTRLDGGWPIAKRKLIVRLLLEDRELTAEWWDALDVQIKLE